MLARRFPCHCNGAGCERCSYTGHLSDRRSYAQTIVTPGPLRVRPTVRDVIADREVYNDANESSGPGSGLSWLNDQGPE
jgi:hypothetical protein